ncbi:hypothetical protein A3G67_02585 [Candidatus Roizmanbacteria bacterium RIFCSPLOWO2_12_FULL_40_12]|uniref:Uncharacterized protein n=1 Tax=Candidatus Roizmanbacteria bacterium RIFCSPLOWO2_01_FULL_40_42 TaxID=1802066 RepID=A0A1F7J607_9BACT|nr:MAG: hypothetical protein A2779_03875 [Candidatus Roizmanbacteria bacterium RIFCSPHIGHO2_01_FULL_40_98]OGK27869.1 MAG: hypothetical protein A3C31_03840 [Candidatus Roizmanbacteria bacterium RIFCSPHIGHO2_02_FULL_40_53]OGK29420.1 MAG: hypothetical protein A2W49_04205 [Candidatus Roizmanbacteria bacterium RIFCSPHIGHO2_12_41_18]OGK36623.1 MAG: hypothetical protein A3E69_00110 [Candidatus Roizmanbacteria bacterium RIFCSPHIGHO2_12_FULL_40_130]OGK51061.1 MAG: hypothetical protein A3B50_02760 [Candi
MTITERIQKWWKNLPEKKKYLEIVTALLSIPVLATAILLNVGNLRNNKTNETVPAQPAANNVTIVPVELKDKGTTPTGPQCKKEVGPVDIIYPTENQKVSDSPLCIDIAQKSGDFCSVQWSYKLDEGDWSSFNDKLFCFNNLSSGEHKIQVIVKSTVSQDQTLLERNFEYQSKSSSPTPATSAASLSQ